MQWVFEGGGGKWDRDVTYKGFGIGMNTALRTIEMTGGKSRDKKRWKIRMNVYEDEYPGSGKLRVAVLI